MNILFVFCSCSPTISTISHISAKTYLNSARNVEFLKFLFLNFETNAATVILFLFHFGSFRQSKTLIKRCQSYRYIRHFILYLKWKVRLKCYEDSVRHKRETHLKQVYCRRTPEVFRICTVLHATLFMLVMLNNESCSFLWRKQILALEKFFSIHQSLISALKNIGMINFMKTFG